MKSEFIIILQKENCIPMFLQPSFLDKQQQYRCNTLGLRIIVISLFLIGLHCQNDTQIFRFKSSFDTYMWLSKSLSISPNTPQVIVGSRNGTVKIFNYNTGELQFESNQQDSSIVGTAWIKDRNGLIIASTNEKMNTSMAIIRDRQTFEQTHRWEFTQTMKNIDYTECLWESYVAFNFMNKIEEYGLRMKNKTKTYYAFGGYRFTQISYSSNYSFIYALGKFSYYDFYFIHHIPAGSNQDWYYWQYGYLSQLQANKYDYEDNPFVYKFTDDDGESIWRAEDYQYFPNFRFPTNHKMKFFRFCPTDYVLGVTSQNLLIFYSNDYLFTEISVIDKFSQEFIDIVQLECKNRHILVAGANNYLYVFELFPFEEQEATNWLKIWFLIGMGVIICLLFGLLIYKKVMKARLVKKARLNQELLDSDNLQSETRKGRSGNKINESVVE